MLAYHRQFLRAACAVRMHLLAGPKVPDGVFDIACCKHQQTKEQPNEDRHHNIEGDGTHGHGQHQHQVFEL